MDKMNFGFIAPEITVSDWILGAKPEQTIRAKTIRPDGQWDAHLPVMELQRKAFETYNCTNFGTLSAGEIIHKTKYGTEPNWCERYLGVISGTTKRGNSPQIVAEAIRKQGCIQEEFLPYNDTIRTWNQYYSPKPMTEKYLAMGRDWLTRYKFSHEYTFLPYQPLAEKQDRMMKALLSSPLGVSVLAWKQRNGLYWKNPSDGDNHWVVCYGYVKGKYWKIFDSYDAGRKKLEWNYSFNYGKNYQLTKTSTEEVKKKTMLQKKEGTEEVFITIGGERYWIKDVKDFDNLKSSQPIDGIEWKNVEEVNIFTKPYNGAIIGKPNFSDLLRRMFGNKK